MPCGMQYGTTQQMYGSKVNERSVKNRGRVCRSPFPPQITMKQPKCDDRKTRTTAHHNPVPLQ